MTADHEVRQATAEDVAAVQRVASAAWHAAYDEILDPETVDETVDSWYDPEGLLEDDIRNPERPFFVAVRTDSATVVGFVEAAAADEPGVWHLYRIYVHPEVWGEGVGSALLDRVETTLRGQDVDTLSISVLADNEVGVGIYEARGFEHVETSTDETFEVPRAEYRKQL